MEVREIKSQQEWQSFLDVARPHTFLNSWGWGECEFNLGRPIWRLGVYRGEILLAVAFFSKTTARRGTFLLCHHGPVIDPKYIDETKNILEALKLQSINIARSEKCDFIRFSPVLANTNENIEVFRQLGFRDAPIHVHSECSWILDITKSDEELLKEMRKGTRYAIKKAQKDGVETVASEDLKDFENFWSVYMDTVRRQKFTPYSRSYLYNEFKVFLENKQALIFFGKFKGEIIATAFIIYTSNSGFYHHGASTQKFSGVSAAEFLQWSAIQEAKKRGCTEYNFWGVVSETATKHPWYGLSRFKRGFGGREESHVHAKDLPLKIKYWLTWLIEYTRKIKRGV